MNRFVIGLALVFVVFTACKGEKEQAIIYNDLVVGIHDGIAIELKLLDSAVYSNNAQEMAVRLTAYREALRKAEERLAEIEHHESDTAFSAASLQMVMDFRKIGSDYDSLVRLLMEGGSSSDSMNVMRIAALQKSIPDDYDRFHSAFIRSQLDFAVDNKFILTQDRK